MAIYKWRGKDLFQNKIKGVIIADNPQQARQRLYQQGIVVHSFSRNWQLFSRLTPRLQAEFLLQFSLLLHSGIPLKQSLQLLQENCHHQALYQLITRCLQNLHRGLPLSHTLQAEKNLLSHSEWQLLYSGEQSGQLAQVMQQLADNKQKQVKLRQQINKILFYPIMMLTISLLLTLFLLLFIVPTFADLYQQQQQQLPYLTQFLLTLSQFIKNDFIFLLIAIILLCTVIYWSYNKLPQLKIGLLKLVCLIPTIEKIYLQTQAIHFCSILATMLQAGITLQQSLQTFLPSTITFAQSPKLLLEKEAYQCLSALQQGFRFSDGLSYGFLSQQTRQMIAIGEQSGQLDTMLHYVANHLQQQLSNQIDLFAKLLEPILMLIIGAIIGVIILGMYLPIFNLGNVIL